MATPTLILGANNWAIEEDNILGYALGSSSNQYLPREISFTRGSDATYTDSTGVVRQACWNLLQYSEQFDNSYWTKIASSVSTNTILSPDGTTNADIITENTVAGRHFAYASLTTITGTTYSASIYVKNLSRRYVTISLKNVSLASPVYSATFDLDSAINTTTFSGGSPANTSNFITDVGNGWYRIGISMQAASTSTYLEIGLSNSATPSYSEGMASYTGDGASALYYWGAQIVQGAQPLAYLRTTDRLNVPRVDSSTGSKAFLLEPQRTNVCLQSEDFSSAIWTKTSVTVTANSTTAPDGNTTADTLSKSAGGDATCTQEMTATSTGYAGTVFIKQDNDETRFPEFFLRSSSASGQNEIYVQLNTKTGATATRLLIGTASTTAPVLIGGYWRMSLYVLANSNTCRVGLRPAAGTTLGSYNANASGSIIAWGMQVESNVAYPTTYIPTTTSSATRIADSAVRTGISSLIGQTEGTLFLAGSLQKYNESGFYIAISDGASLGNALYLYQPTSGNLQVLVRRSGNPDGVVTIPNASWNVGFNKIAIAYTLTTTDVYLNGVLIGSTTFIALPSFSQFTLGSRPDSVGGLVGVGTYNTAQVYNTRLTNAELAALTTL